ncbi:MAG: hypothetical protein PSV35_02265 [bacterium]|nr:hypothetical protein [bacterium]
MYFLIQTQNKIEMISDGTPWRSLVHVLDISKAIKCCLLAPASIIHKQIFNVRATDVNYQIKVIAMSVSPKFATNKLLFGKEDGAQRSYRVSFD